MGESNSDKFLSEKDPSSTMEFNCSVRPPLESQKDQCQTAPLQDADDEPQQKEERVPKEQDQQQQEVEDKYMLEVSPVKSKLPSLGEFNVHEDGEVHEKGAVHENGDEENNDGFKTPTSLDHKIPSLLKCPPAPRRPGYLQAPKRKDNIPQTILLDLTKEIEALFPPAFLADLGKKIKKARQGSDFE
ncbi:cyclin-dependent protein kinase inhibitor SMR3-like [Herrania umbratica]|uniref:Cyclin-dependent protein kinase inhibitor SMR3-like n=1 Tax=Herrania umbratica TaxID=108875 RepID=A0A6J0ZVR3_9ROSI|nr:cyclin-dependent protein kinase inhibitor SMR3-like [Herrania umbratica]XP_021278757.1 cyclin-dependent protein kinase inhibitor SMR3-like [Herrania umbratica]